MNCTFIITCHSSQKNVHSSHILLFIKYFVRLSQLFGRRTDSFYFCASNSVHNVANNKEQRLMLKLNLKIMKKLLVFLKSATLHFGCRFAVKSYFWPLLCHDMRTRAVKNVFSVYKFPFPHQALKGLYAVCGPSM